MEILGYFLAALVGISLGLIGGGGSILMVPILVYVLDLDATLATSYSLFVVGTTALVGAYTNFRKGLVSIQTALLFGFSSIATVFLTRKFLVPQIPDQLFRLGGFVLTRATATMVLFALLMLMASTAMIRTKKEEIQKQSSPVNYFKLFAYGIFIGLITGFLGAGGGFLIIPVLVLILQLPMKQAVGTSLLIIALNSLIGFTGDIGNYTIDWFLLLSISSIAVGGIVVGGLLAQKIDASALKKAFGWFVLVMGIYIIINELFL